MPFWLMVAIIAPVSLYPPAGDFVRDHPPLDLIMLALSVVVLGRILTMVLNQ